VRTIKVEKQDVLAASDVETKSTGLEMKLTDGTFIKVADIKNVTNWKESVVKDTEFKGVFDYKKPSAAIITGYLEIPEDGIYEFATDVDQLFIGGNLLVDNDGEVKRFSRNNATIALGKGKHAIKMIYLNNIIGGWPQSWNAVAVNFKKEGDEKFTKAEGDMFSY